MTCRTATSPLSAVVVAGGGSTRLGQDKRALRLWGEDGPALLEHTVMIIARHCAEVIVVLNDPEHWPGLPARIVPDIYPGIGPLGGIYSGLVTAAHPFVFAIASDMPLLNPGLIAWMIAQPRDYDVLVPRIGAGRARNRLGVESLHAIYGTACREPMRRQLDAGNPQVIGFYPDVRVQIVEHEVIAGLDPAGTAFRNINTPDELAEVRAMIGHTSTAPVPRR
jgi:molybdopterin-guanine dinucleotide biosynthesis protein A